MAFSQYIIPVAVSFSAAVYIIFKIFPWLKYDIEDIHKFAQVVIRLWRLRRQRKLIVDIFEDRTDATPEKNCLIFQDNNYSFQFMDKQMNKMANTALSIGLKKGEVVAMLMGNEPAFIWTAYGLCKIGVEPAFLNFNLRSQSLLHCFVVSGAKVLIVGQGDLIQAVEEIYPELVSSGVTIYVHGGQDRKLPEGFIGLDDQFDKASDKRPSKHYRLGIGFRTPMCYIYTSGTTGLPKAAVVTHDKVLKGALLMSFVDMKQDDIFYTPLPLYHSAAGIIALGAMVYSGGTLVLRNKFSASHFMDDCCKHKVTVVQYIGELCRYLCARPKSSDDSKHCIRAAMGNGLRRDIWQEFSDRFKIPIICEFYAATEGNVGFVNYRSKFGAIGRSSPLLQLAIPTHFIRYDVATDEPVRDANGFCISVGVNEPGLMVSLIKRDFYFDGYKGNKELSDKKIIRNVFKKGDAYLNSGDLLEFDEDYFVYFNDRVGDTFRWKGENVSTIEVSNVITSLKWVEDVNIFGVEIPGQDGRAGMASMTLVEDHEYSTCDLENIYSHCNALLPRYAMPRFLRIQNTHDMTATFKLRKIDLIKEGFDPSNVKSDPLFCLDMEQKTYIPIGDEIYNRIISGTMRL